MSKSFLAIKPIAIISNYAFSKGSVLDNFWS